MRHGASSWSSTRQEGDENAIKEVRKQEPAHCLSRRPSSFFFSHSSLQSRPTIAWPSHVRLDPLSALGPALPLNPPRRREVQTDASRPPRTRTLSKKRPARTTSSSCVCVPRRCSSSAAFPPTTTEQLESPLQLARAAYPGTSHSATGASSPFGFGSGSASPPLVQLPIHSNQPSLPTRGAVARDPLGRTPVSGCCQLPHSSSLLSSLSSLSLRPRPSLINHAFIASCKPGLSAAPYRP